MKKLSVLVCVLCMMAGTAFAQDAKTATSTQTVKAVMVDQGDAVEASTSTEVNQVRGDVKEMPAAKKACCASKAAAAKSGSSCTAAQKAACTPEQKAACAEKKAACGAKAAAVKKEDTPN